MGLLKKIKRGVKDSAKGIAKDPLGSLVSIGVPIGTAIATSGWSALPPALMAANNAVSAGVGMGANRKNDKQQAYNQLLQAFGGTPTQTAPTQPSSLLALLGSLQQSAPFIKTAWDARK